MEKNVRDAGAYEHLGRDIDGKLAKFTITEAGLLGAAHREGQEVLKDYLEHQQRNGWTSNFDNISEAIKKKYKERDPKRPAKIRFLAVETRLRELAGIPCRLWLDH